MTIDLLDHRNTCEFLILNSLEEILDLCPNGIMTQFWRVIHQGFLTVGTSVSLVCGMNLVFLEILLTPTSSIGSSYCIVTPSSV